MTESDRAHLAVAGPGVSVGMGERPALLLVDNYHAAVGDEPLPLLEAIERWPSATGPSAWAALAVQEKVLDAARKLGLPVIHVTGMAEGNIPGWGWCAGHPEARGSLRGPVNEDAAKYRIVDPVAPREDEFVIRKVAPSAFFGTALTGLLNFLHVDTLVVVGESTSGCVRATVVDGTSYRLRMIVVEDGCYDRHEAAHAINLFDMDRKYADVLPASEVCSLLSALRAEAPA